MLDDATARRICDAVDSGFAAQLQFTRQLVALPSQRGQEQAAQESIARALGARGFSVDRWAIDVEEIRDHPGFSPVSAPYDDAINVVGTHRPREVRGRSLILNGHVDVVPTGPLEMWTHPPYEARVVDGWLHGRGSGDMKAGLAANLFAFDALRAVGLEPAAPVYLQSVVEEECTGNGALACLTRGYRADAALITEPMNDALVRANVGVLWFQVEVRGRPAHVFESQKGNSAIVSTYPIIQALQRLETEWNAKKEAQPHFGAIEKPITINVGKIEGGDWASSVPCWCRIEVRAGFYPGTSVADARAEIEAVIRAACRDDPYLSEHPPTVRYEGFAAEGYVLEPGSDAETCLRRAHRRVCARELRAEASPAYLDGRVFVLYDDTPALVYGPVCERIHGFDERVELTSVRRVTQAVALFMADWCGLAPRP